MCRRPIFAFTKFAYKRMVYDVGVDFGYVHNIHDGIEERSTYFFFGGHEPVVGGDGYVFKHRGVSDVKCRNVDSGGVGLSFHSFAVNVALKVVY